MQASVMVYDSSYTHRINFEFKMKNGSYRFKSLYGFPTAADSMGENADKAYEKWCELWQENLKHDNGK